MGRPHRDPVVEVREPLQRPVLRAGQLLGPVRGDQVGAGRGADQQRPAGEDPEHPRPVEQQVRQVLIRVPRGRQRPQRQPAQVDLVAVHQPAVRVLPVPGGRGKDGRAVLGRELDARR